VVDLLIREENRGQGLGKVFMRGLESVCKELGYDRLHLSVDPEGNSAALGFYRALGYRASPSVPKWRRWSFRDSKGGLHQGEGPELDMFREIR
jgi:GNAT superfamily N-acetyltransferase